LADETDKSRTQRLRALQAEEGKRAMAEYVAQSAGLSAKIERLRALRLARDAAAPAVPPASPAARPAKKAPAKKRTKVQNTPVA
jgi:hypothetical protein